MTQPTTHPTATRRLALAIRYVVPAILLVAGTIVWIVASGDDEAIGSLMVGAACAIVVVNVFLRLAFSSQDDRDREEAARQARAASMSERNAAARGRRGSG